MATKQESLRLRISLASLTLFAVFAAGTVWAEQHCFATAPEPFGQVKDGRHRAKSTFHPCGHCKQQKISLSRLPKPRPNEKGAAE